MRVVLISGLWPTKDHNGLDQLLNRILDTQPGLEIDVYFYDEYEIRGGDVLIGFSLGAERAVKLASQTQTPVRYLALIDPVANWVPCFWMAWHKFQIPSNVLLADCFTRKAPLMPPSGKIGNTLGRAYFNYEISSNHADAPRNQFCVDVIVNRMKSLK